MTLLDPYVGGLAAGLRREPELTVTEWADEHRMLSLAGSAEPGRWRTPRTPYLAKIMDCLSPSHPAQRVVVMAGAQVGKTECGNNWIGYVIHHSPGPMLMVQPTVELAKRVSKQRIAPMIEATPALRERVAEARSRDSGNTVQVKEFEGGLLIITGANSSAGLRSMPIRFLFMDEVDEYPGDVDGQGDPVALAEKRTSTFPRRKILLTSTPTIKGLSRIEREYLASDQQRYFVPCARCGRLDYLTWGQPEHHRIEWDEGQPETARMCCPCGGVTLEHEKVEVMEGGEWRATAAGDRRTVGFHLSAIYSTVGLSWAECAREFLEAKEEPLRLKTWVNTVLGETWEERGTSIEPESLASRLDRYEAEVPHGVGVLVAGVDVQADRLEAQVKGYGAGEESWLIAHTQVHGDPGRQATWLELDRFLRQPWAHASGRRIGVECTAVDSQFHSEEVYRFCKARLSRRVFAVRGGTMRGVELVGRPSTNNRYGTPLFTLCTDTAKDVIYSRLAIRSPGPGYVHLPDWVDQEYLEQLTAEKAVRKWYKHKGTLRDWVKVRERNEALDLEVYCLAALYILGQPFVRDLGRAAETLSRAPDGPRRTPLPESSPTLREPGAAARLRKRRRSWIDSWRK